MYPAAEQLAAKTKRLRFLQIPLEPFTEGHKAMIRTVAEMGFDVFLNVHALSWKKRAGRQRFGGR